MDVLIRDEYLSCFSRCAWTPGSSPVVGDISAQLLRLFERIEDVLYSHERSIAQCENVVYVDVYGMRSERLDFWNESLRTYNLQPDERFYKKCLSISASVPVNPRSPCLRTWEINEDAGYHGALLGRKSETLSYGILRGYEWLRFYLEITTTHFIELKYIAGLVKQCGGVPFIVKKGSNDVIVDLKLFYNISSLVESLLQVSFLRFYLSKHRLKLFISVSLTEYREVNVNLHDILDELALELCCDPKFRINEIRRYLNFVTRAAGALAVVQATFKHMKLSDRDKTLGDSLVKEVFDGENFFLPYVSSKAFQENLKEGSSKLRSFSMTKLDSFCRSMLKASLVKTEVDDFVRGCSFLQLIMTIGGYGRALNYASSPRSAPEKTEDKYDIAGDIKTLLFDLHNKAITQGFAPPSGMEWISAGVASWKATSAGVQSMDVVLSVDGVPRKVKVRKKSAIGATLGLSAFSRAFLEKRLDLQHPGNVGYRDVPVKFTRAIYVVPLQTQYAMTAAVSHLVNYVSSRGENNARADLPIDASHFITGSEAMIGTRIIDNYDTICNSGDRECLVVDTDLSEFDSHLVRWNFREPLVEALRGVLSGETFGPEKITGEEMVDYAYGEGRIYDTIWDNGREPLVVFRKDKKGCDEYMKEVSNYVRRITVRPRLQRMSSDGSSVEDVGLKSLPGCSMLHAGDHDVFDIDGAIDTGLPLRWEFLKVGVRLDGEDLIRLTSEASGELSTLMMNTVANLAMQRIALRIAGQTNFGKSYRVLYTKGVGDDAEWSGRIIGGITAKMLDEYLDTLEDVYAAMGHIFSRSKTYVIPLSAEFVQTFARMGLYIPRDQIMIVQSERPRTVRDPISYLRSFRSVLASKVARGMSTCFANAVYFVHALKLNRLSLKRHRLKIRDAEDATTHILLRGSTSARVRVPSFSLERIPLKPGLFVGERQNHFAIVLNPLILFLPPEWGGCGFNPLCISVVHTPALFISWISEYSAAFQRDMLSFAHFFRSRDLGSVLSETETDGQRPYIDISGVGTGFAWEELFSDAARMRINRLSKINLGKLNAENIPRRLIETGFEMESIMEVDANSVRERRAEGFMQSLRQAIPVWGWHSDEWVLSYDVVLSDQSEKLTYSSFYQGIENDLVTLFYVFGISWSGNRVSNFADRLRMIISRDHLMKNLISPDTVLGLFHEYGVSTISDEVLARALLLRIGLSDSVAREIASVCLSANEDYVKVDFEGAFSDEFGYALNLMTRDRFDKFEWPSGYDASGKRILFRYAMQWSVLKTLMTGVPHVASGLKRSSFDMQRCGLSNFPRSFFKLVEKRRKMVGLETAFLHDILEMPTEDLHES